MFKCPECKNIVDEYELRCHSCGESLEQYVRIYEGAQSGDMGMQAVLGALYRHGVYVNLDPFKGFYWTEKAALAGYADAQGSLGDLYYKGMGTQKNLKKAFEWTRKGAEQGSVMAQCELGVYYWNGEGVEEDEIRALYWWQKAKDNGSSDASMKLDSLGISEVRFLDESTMIEIAYKER